MLHQRCLTGFRIFLRFSIWQDSKYVWVTQDFEQNAQLYIFDRVLNMHAVLKWQGYRELRVLCKLYSRDSRCKLYADGIETTGILNMPQVLNIPWFWMYQESKYVRISQGILTGFSTIPCRPDKIWGRGHLLRENFSLCLQTRCIIVAWKKRWWVVWGGWIAEIWGCTQGAPKISKKS